LNVKRGTIVLPFFSDDLRLKFLLTFVLVQQRPEPDLPLRPGTLVVLDIYSVMRSPHIFSNPESFQPKRWESPTPKMLEVAGFPFGHGSRSCFGRALALLEIKVAIAHIVHTLELSTEKTHCNPEMEQTFGLRPKGNVLRLSVARRLPVIH
jgi:cytochrome P450